MINKHSIGTRTYFTDIPESTKPTKAVILLHGAHGTPEQFATEPYVKDFTQMCRAEGWALVAPKSSDKFTGKFAGRWESETSDNDDVSFISFLVDMLHHQGIKRIVIVGGSSGGIMATRVANLVDGIVMVNALDCEQVYIEDDEIKFRDQVSEHIKVPVLSVESSEDVLLPLYNKALMSINYYNLGLPVLSYLHKGGDHCWGEWTSGYHANMIGFIRGVLT